ncbi:MAG: hypothetical protein AB1758_14395 [Candidatus Eremiobacterota bacterium]
MTLLPSAADDQVADPTAPASGDTTSYTTEEWSFDLSEFLSPSDRIRMLLWRER